MAKVNGFDGWYDNKNAICVAIKGLNCSEGENNHNKYYNCEILELNGQYRVYSTYGRQGSKGQISMKECGNSDYCARTAFEELIEAKKNGRSASNSRYIEVDLVAAENCSEAGKNLINKQSLPVAQQFVVVTDDKDDVKIDIEPEVHELVETIYYEANKAISSTLTSGKVDSSNKSPMGTLGLNGINKGRDILREIGILLNKSNNSYELKELSNKFNSYIPRIMPRDMKTNTSWIIDSSNKIQEQLDLLDIYESALGMVKIMSDSTGIKDKYLGLKSDIKLIKDQETMNYIINKIDSSYAPNHHFRAKVVKAFEVNQKNAVKFDDSCGNVRHLFHGTRNANLMGILSSNLKLPTNLKGVTLTGAMFGPGLYFASEFSKSFNYSMARFSGASNKTNKYYIFICEVALGNVHKVTQSKNYEKAPKGYDSVMGVGERTLKNMISRGEMPAGSYTSLINNEFIVYKPEQQRIKYLVEMELL